MSAYANRRPPAKTNKIGFLHLPDEVKKHIYELAIYDHDRDVVFLPRALPRRVTPETDLDVVHEHDGYGLRPERFFSVLPTSRERTTVAGGRFVNGIVRAEARRESSVELGDYVLGSDEESSTSDIQHSDTDPETESLDTDVTSDDASQGSFHESITLPLDPEDSDISDNSDDYEYGPCDGDEIYELKDGRVLIEDPEHGWATVDCLASQCEDQGCEYCAGHGLGPDQDESTYVDDPGELQRMNDYWIARGLNGEMTEDEDHEDDEHFDSEEMMGMLYEPEEPAILLTCMEIRAQCLPIYYGRNAFSWRFNWLKYGDCYQKFCRWLDVVGENTKHIRRFTFEGRHAVEEGIDFVVDIDLTDTEPYFHLHVEEDSDHDLHMHAITDLLQDELGDELEKLAQVGSGGITFTASNLATLGRMFVLAMERDAAANSCFTWP